MENHLAKKPIVKDFFRGLIIDCFDDTVVSWSIGTTPSAELVSTKLDEVIATLAPGERPLLHSDRGGHYRWPGWIERVERAGLTRSMSKRACTADNAACAGFFGTIKTEMFYGRSWEGVSIKNVRTPETNFETDVDKPGLSLLQTF